MLSAEVNAEKSIEPFCDCTLPNSIPRFAIQNSLQHSAFSIASDMFVDELLERCLVGEADNLLDNLTALEDEHGRNAHDAEP